MDLNNDKDILQNLKDAACSEELIKEFFSLKTSGNDKLIMQLLYQHKTRLLKNLHYYQKKIDCLDYLIFQLNQTK